MNVKKSAKKTATKKAAAKKPAAAKPGPATATKKAAAKKKTAPAAKKKTVAAKKKTAPAAKKKAVAKKKKTAAPAKPRAAAKKKAAAPAAKPTAAAKKKAAAPAAKPTAAAAERVEREVPPPRPSDRAMAVVAQLPLERALTDEERDAMAKCARTALVTLDADGVPSFIVTRIGAFVDEVRGGRRPPPASQDVRLGLGVLWGEQVRAQVGWRWVHLSYPNGFASYALVPDDRAFACFPLNRLSELMRPGAEGTNTSAPLFDSIRTGMLPARRENAYLVIG